MPTCPVQVNRLPQMFVSDDRRMITRFFTPGDEARNRAIVGRVQEMPETEVGQLLEEVLARFGPRHRDVKGVLLDHFNRIRQYVDCNGRTSENRKLLIGSYFTMEYAIESAALFNPSIVLSPNQNDVPSGAVRFLMSLRATGEGHVSSIVFRRGLITADGDVEFDPVSPYTHRLKTREDRVYDKHTFRLKLIEIGAYQEATDGVMDRLDDLFTLHDLNEAIHQHRTESDYPETIEQAARDMLWLARSNYVLELPEGMDPSEIVIFPSTDNESRGIEDARFVRFIDDDGKVYYYGTYTAYNGFRILPQLIEIEQDNFQVVRVHTLNGRFVQNKGMALFPRKVDGWHLMISRLDGENLYLMRSDNIHFWNDAEMLQTPRFPWEFVQIGNCGSPIETEAGWLLLTHGVGPMRRYCIGASLLDRDDPLHVIGQTREPLIVPSNEDRGGYVPNVVYTCGAMAHRDTLYIPYAINDVATTFATINMPELLDYLKK